MKILLMVICLMALSACTATHEIQVISIKPPEELLHCAETPKPPAKNTVSDIRLWSARVYYAGEDCRAQLGRVRGFVAESH